MAKVTKKEALEELVRRQAINDFWKYCLYMDYEFFSKRPILKNIAIALNNAYYSDKKHHKVYIAIYRRVGKSYTLNLFISWVLGKNYKQEVMRASYSLDKASELNASIFNMIMANNKYKQLFNVPTLIVDNQEHKQFEGHYRPSLIAVSSKTGSTGSGCSVVIADDLYKNVEEALSKTQNAKVINNYFNTIANSLDGKKNIEIITGTRWAYGELADILLAQNYFDDVVIIPAIDENGNASCPEVKTVEELELERKKIGEAMFLALWQQQPMISKDALFQIGDFDYVNDETINSSYIYSRFAVIDPKSTGTDYYSVGVYAVTDNGVILEDVIFQNIVLSNDLIKKTAMLLNAYNVNYIFIETNKEFTLSIALKDMVSSKIETFSTVNNKQVKILTNASKIKQIKLRQTSDEEYNLFLKKMFEFDIIKIGKSNNEDDSVDNMAIAVIKMKENARKLGVNYVE